jgi:hypothetical protein
MKYLLVCACLCFLGCAANPPDPSVARKAAELQRKPRPNLDRTYDWGSKPPGAETHPDHVTD